MSVAGRVYSRPESRFLWLEYRNPQGDTVRRSAKTTSEKEAKLELAREIARQGSLTFREVVEDFFAIKGRSLRKATIANYRVSLRAVHPHFGEGLLVDITQDALKAFIRARRQTVSDTAVKRDLAFVSSVFSHVMETMPKAPEVNPVIHLSKKGLVETQRVRWLRPSEYERVLEACSNDMQKIVIETAVHTGMRHQEMTSLRKSMIDFKRKEIILNVEMNKNHRERVVPLCEYLCVRLEELCAETPDDLVFCYYHPVHHRWNSYGSFARFWTGVRTRAKLKDVRFHDLRHTFASWWVQAGGGLLPLRDVLGHSSLQMVQRYAHLHTAAHHEEIRKVFEHSLHTGTNNQ